MVVNKIISSMMQILILVLIPFVWWLITARNKESFISWIGLKKISGSSKKVVISSIATTVGFLLLGYFIQYLLQSVETAVSEFNGLGIRAIPAIFIYAVFNTSFPEELLFRGFLLKRMRSQIGFLWANVMQALLFGLIHCMMFWNLAGKISAFIILAFTGLIAWTMGYINEKMAGGSILPSWCIHAVSNLFTGICAAFMLI